LIGVGMAVETPAAGHFAQGDPRLPGMEIRRHLREQLLHPGRGELEHLGELARGDRGLGDEQDRLEGCLLVHDAHSETMSMSTTRPLRTSISASQSSWASSTRPHRAISSSARKYAATSTRREQCSVKSSNVL